jgi:hypothetical protein
MTKKRLILVAVLVVVVAQALIAARYALPIGGRSFYEGGGG